MKGPLEVHVKYMGVWLMKAGKNNIDEEDLIPELEKAMLLFQRTIDMARRGMKLDKNMIEIKDLKEFEKMEFFPK